jgi:hypothetical protein
MKYLEGKPSFKLTYRKRSALSNGLSGYCDSDLGQQRINLFLYNRAPVSWKSKLHKTIALSTAEAECYPASTAAVEVIYLRYLRESMKLAQPTCTPVHEHSSMCIEWGNSVIGGRERAKRSALISATTSRPRRGPQRPPPPGTVGHREPARASSN